MDGKWAVVFVRSFTILAFFSKYKGLKYSLLLIRNSVVLKREKKKTEYRCPWKCTLWFDSRASSECFPYLLYTFDINFLSKEFCQFYLDFNVLQNFITLSVYIFLNLYLSKFDKMYKNIYKWCLSFSQKKNQISYAFILYVLNLSSVIQSNSISNLDYHNFYTILIIKELKIIIVRFTYQGSKGYLDMLIFYRKTFHLRYNRMGKLRILVLEEYLYIVHLPIRNKEFVLKYL